jgi:hypothetical protein
LAKANSKEYGLAPEFLFLALANRKEYCIKQKHNNPAPLSFAVGFIRRQRIELLFQLSLNRNALKIL